MATVAPFRTALAGCGRISTYHVAALREVPGVEIVAVCDLRLQLAAELAAREGIPQIFTDFETMMKEASPEVVHILTPPQSHVELGSIAAEYGAHLYVEKPFATTLEDARALMSVGEEAGVTICAGHSRLFEPPFREACRRIENGEIGRIVSLRAEQGFTYEAEARSTAIPWYYTYDWGIFDNLVPHPLSLLVHFLEEPGAPQVVGLNLGDVSEAAVEELRVVLPSRGAIGELSLSLTSPEVNRFEIVGTRGRILVDFDALTVLSRRDSALPAAVRRFTANFNTAARLSAASVTVAARLATKKTKRYMGIRALVADFYRALREGTAPPVAGEHVLTNVRLIEQIKDACRELEKARVTKQDSASSQRADILVTGASGFLGSRLVEFLAERGVRVRAGTRLISRARDIPNVEWVQLDLTREDDVRRAVAGVSTIFHCAGMVGPPGSLPDYDAVNVDGTVRLAEFAAEEGVERLVYVSSLSVYGIPARGNVVVEEDAGYDPRAADRGVYTQSKVTAEKALVEFVHSHDRPWVVLLRPGTIYGPGADLPVGVLRLPSSDTRPAVVGGPSVPVALTYVDNLIDAMLAAADADVPSGSVYNIVDSGDLDQGEILRRVREISEGRIRPLVVPYPVAWMLMLGFDLGSLVHRGRLGSARFRLKRSMARMRFPSAAAREHLGWEPRVTFAEGLERTMAADAGLDAP